MKRIAVLVSGGGTNLQAIIDAIQNGGITNGKIVKVIASKEGVYALKRAEKHGIAATVISRKQFDSVEAYDRAMTEELQKDRVDLIVLAGFLSILGEQVIQAFPNRILNIHPALIPSFCGPGFYGLHVHKAALEKGVKVTGATVHFVNEIVDGGAILLQKAVDVQEGDTPDILQKRVMEQAEWHILPQAIDLFCNDRIVINENHVSIKKITEGHEMKKRALISVSDKAGVVDFAKNLEAMGFEIVSTGGTAKALSEAGVAVINVSDITGFPECLDGRVKTLHPKIHAGILAMRSNPEHMKTLEELEVNTIDVVAINLYPFKATIRKENVSMEECIENIDIGGPTMIRAAAKNWQDVAVIVDPSDYDRVVNELKADGCVSRTTKLELAFKVFEHTSDYDTMIANYLKKKVDVEQFRDTFTVTYEKVMDLRYGENPHQKAVYYKEVLPAEGSIVNAKQLHGKELSFNNINDTNGALQLLKEFREPTVVAVKHANPCGVGVGETIFEAYQKAYEADPVSIFGGIVAANREIDEKTAEEINKIFIEIVIAPSFSEKAFQILSQKKNIRLLTLENILSVEENGIEFKKVSGGLLVQNIDNELMHEADLECVTEEKPTKEQMEQLKFAWKVVKHTKSNAIVLAKDNATIGVGPGQTNRITALELAIKYAAGKTEGSVMASDAFFPFSDCVEAAHKAGIKAIIQPGGSIRDQESIDACNRYGIAMVFTKMRHFKH